MFFKRFACPRPSGMACFLERFRLSPAMDSGIMPSKPLLNCSTCTTPVASRLSGL